jgi:hypothetical protein
MEDNKFIDQVFHDKVADAVSNSILRVWLSTIYNPEPISETYTSVFLHYGSGEGQKRVRKSTTVYIKNMLKSP